MIVPDVNMLIFAYNEDSPDHEQARIWWQDLSSSDEAVGIPWVVSSGFMRLMTNPRSLRRPLGAAEAVDLVSEWFRFPHITPINPGERHLIHLRYLLDTVGMGANLVTDAHIAAIAIEYDAIVHTNDSDFARFPGVHCHFPLR